MDRPEFIGPCWQLSRLGVQKIESVLVRYSFISLMNRELPGLHFFSKMFLKQGYSRLFKKSIFWPFLTPCNISTKSKQSNFKLSKKFIFVQFFFSQNWQNRTPPKKSSHLSIYGPVTSCKKSEKNNESFLGSTYAHTQGGGVDRY